MAETKTTPVEEVKETVAEAPVEEVKEAVAETPEVKEEKPAPKPKKVEKTLVAEMGTIGAKTKVEGNINTCGHLTILGEVKGDVIALGNVVVKGNVQGKIKCANLMVETEKLTADVEAQGTIIVKENMGLEGKAVAKDITIAGTVNGKLQANNSVGLASTAVVTGDIKAAQLATDFGAKIKGSVTIG